jgi:hypothetical protein
MLEDRGRTGEKEAHRVGQERRGRRAVPLEVTLHRFDGLGAIPPGALEDCIPLRWCGSLHRGDHQAWGVAYRHDCRLEDAPPRLAPGRRGRGELLVQAAPAGRACAMRPGPRSPLLGQGTGLLEEGDGLAEEDRITG